MLFTTLYSAEIFECVAVKETKTEKVFLREGDCQVVGRLSEELSIRRK